jgi:hypothetical protein
MAQKERKDDLTIAKEAIERIERKKKNQPAPYDINDIRQRLDIMQDNLNYLKILFGGGKNIQKGMTRQSFIPSEIEQIREFLNQGCKPATIATKLNRSYGSVYPVYVKVRDGKL